MSKPAIDRMIAIADAFDRGEFVGMVDVDIDTIASRVGLPVKSITRLLQPLGFERTAERRKFYPRNDRVWEYPPRVRLPNTDKLRNEDAKAIIEAIAAGTLPRRLTSRLLSTRLGDTLNRGTICDLEAGRMPKPIATSLRKLGFTSYRPEGHKPKPVVHPARWQQPPIWPSLFAEQRRLRRNGLRASAVLRMTDAAARIAAVVSLALEQMDFDRVPYDRSGALKEAIRKVLTRAFTEWQRQETRAMADTRAGEPAPTIDWAAVAALDADQLRAFATIAANRERANGGSDNPGAYALRWVRENQPGAGQTAPLHR